MNTPAPHRPNLWSNPDVRRLVLVGTLAFSSFFLTLSSLPLWALSGGAAEGTAGLVTTVMLAATVATQILVPWLARRFGLAPVLAAGLITLGGAAPLYLISHDLWWLLVVSAIRGTGFAVITVLMPLTASAMVGPERRGEVIGIYGLAIAVPNLIGVPIGVALTSAGNFGWVAVLAAAPLLALPLVPRFAGTGTGTGTGSGSGTEPSTRPGIRAETRTPTPPTRGLVPTLKSLSGVTLVLLTVTIAGAGVLTFLPIIAPDGWLATTALLVFGLTAAVSRWRSGILSDRPGRTWLLPAGLAVAALGMTVLGIGIVHPTAVTVLVGVTVLGLGYGAVQNVSLLVAFHRAGPDRQATASSVWNASFDAGTGIGALLIGVVAAAGPGFPCTYVGCAALMALAIPLAARATRPVMTDQSY